MKQPILYIFILSIIFVSNIASGADHTGVYYSYNFGSKPTPERAGRYILRILKLNQNGSFEYQNVHSAPSSHYPKKITNGWTKLEGGGSWESTYKTKITLKYLANVNRQDGFLKSKNGKNKGYILENNQLLFKIFHNYINFYKCDALNDVLEQKDSRALIKVIKDQCNPDRNEIFIE